MNSENKPIPELNLSVNDDASDLADTNDDVSETETRTESTPEETAIASNSEGIFPEPITDIWAEDEDKAEVVSTTTEPEAATIDQSEGDSETEIITEESTETAMKTELVADSWLEESETVTDESEVQHSQPELTVEEYPTTVLTSDIAALEQQKTNLQQEIQQLQSQKETLILQQVRDTQETIGRMVEEGMRELKSRKNDLLVDIEKLERRRERIRQEMRTNFAGASQDLAVRIQGFKEYLVGSLQDLATAAEQLKLPSPEPRPRPQSREPRRSRNSEPQQAPQPQFTERAFAEQNRRIRQLLDQYRTRPDYYGSPWQLRRTFEPIHTERVQDWFFTQGGRGAIKGMDTRLQNILVASAIISVLHKLYGDRCRNLVLVDTPEKLGEWRRGLQDCLGISRSDFGSDRGVVLFESPEVLVQRAERLLSDKLLPFIIIDESEGLINLSLLKFPLWLAFTQEMRSSQSGYLY
ncbi:MAG: DUF3086 domain-containing protein [Xenococcaceae cyanobacterium MO_167.B27]|nr:DUF3086 domain-containing protein [Xenococcaceae cyanobacterium MO_167.B27]